MRVHFLTYGCRVNQYETQAIREQLLSRGHTEAGDFSQAELLVINSCTVTEAADRECVAAIKKIHRRHPGIQVVVTGCLAQKEPRLLAGLPGVRLLAGTHQKYRLAALIEEMNPWGLSPRVIREIGSVYAPLRISNFQGRAKAFLKVQDGCDRTCAFCTIPYVRGRSRSRPVSDILEEVRRLLGAGFKEIVLTGVAIGLWGREWNPAVSLADLIRRLDELPGDFRVRLSSLDPRDVSPSLIDALRDSRRLCHHLHLSLQSGSDSVLGRMRRNHTAGWYEKKADEIRSFWRDLGLTTDLIVGFPGETEQEFEETLELCRRIRFSKVHVFPFSRRRGTTAWFLKGQLPWGVVRERAKILRGLTEDMAREFQKGFIGTLQEVLVEQEVGQGIFEGSAANFMPVRFPGDPAQVGALVRVRIERWMPYGLHANFSDGALDKLTQDVPCLIRKD